MAGPGVRGFQSGRVGGGEGPGGVGFVYVCSRGYSEEGSTFISLVDGPFILLEQLLMENNKTHFHQAVSGILTGQFSAQNRLLQSALVRHQHPLWSGFLPLEIEFTGHGLL